MGISRVLLYDCITMKNISIKTILAVCACFIIGLFGTSSVSAQQQISSFGLPTPTTIDYNLPYPGILPNHPLYFLKNVRDEVLIFFTRSLLKNSRVRLLIADKNLVMATQLIDLRLDKQGVQVLQKGENHLLIALLQLQELKKRGELPAGAVDKFELAARKHEDIINQLMNKNLSEDTKISLNGVLAITHQTIGKISLLK